MDDAFNPVSSAIGEDQNGAFQIPATYKGVMFDRQVLLPYYDMVIHIGSYEVYLIEQYVRNNDEKSFRELFNYDVNADGEVTFADAVALDQYIKGLVPMTNWKFYTTDQTELTTDNKFFLDDQYDIVDTLLVVLNGDANHDFIPSLNVNARQEFQEEPVTLIFELDSDGKTLAYLDEASEPVNAIDFNLDGVQMGIVIHEVMFDQSYHGQEGTIRFIRTRNEDVIPAGRENVLFEFHGNQILEDVNFPVLRINGKEARPEFIQVITDVETLKEQEIKIYPVPVINKLSIKLTPDLKKVKIQVFSLSGKKVFSKRFNSQEDRLIEIKTNDLPAGAYTLKIISSVGVESRQFSKID